ncbi:MAG: mandelate racemase/muconate lactonizing enzyme family protein [Chloroflexota bacterium]
MKIKQIDSIPLKLDLIPDVAPHLYRSNHPGRIVLYRLHLDNGVVGYGEDIGAPTDTTAFIGQNAIAGLKQIKHSGVQMACYDAVGKALSVPAHILMGQQVRQYVPFAYWSIDLPPETWAAQTERAVSLGYQVYKFKCRPWWDPLEQIEQVAAVSPKGFKFWLDFNGHLRETRQALPILQALSEYDCVGGFESPIPQRDAAGYEMLRQKIDKPIAAHYGSGCCHVRSDPNYDRGVPGLTQIKRGLCDGFVLGGGDVEAIRKQAAVAEEAHIPFWLQTVGAGLRAMWVAHLASVFIRGTLAHLAAHDLWQQDIVTPPKPTAGLMTVPDAPGLGAEVDEAAIESLRADTPFEVPRHISTVIYPDGYRWHFATEQQRHEAYHFGDLLGFVPGIQLTVRDDDGSKDFETLYNRCLAAPVFDTA